MTTNPTKPAENDNKMRRISTEHLTTIIKEAETDPVILFGAGASATSGVPMAHDMATQAARWLPL